MKNFIFIVSILLLLSSCEDVVSIDTPSEAPRLIIDAIIRVDLSNAKPIRVKVSETNAFFDEIPTTNLEGITMTNLETNQSIVDFIEISPESGIYEPLDGTTTTALATGDWVLQVNHKDQRYLARTSFVPTVPIDTIIQGTNTFFDEDDTEIIVTFTDDETRNDFYLFDFDFDEFLVTEDQFYQGQEFSFSYFYEDGIAPGEEIEVSLMGVDQQLFNFMNQLIDQSDSQGFGPFDTPAATVRGNIINVTEIDNIDFFDNVDQTDNFALGYFAIVETYKKKITIE